MTINKCSSLGCWRESSGKSVWGDGLIFWVTSLVVCLSRLVYSCRLGKDPLVLSYRNLQCDWPCSRGIDIWALQLWMSRIRSHCTQSYVVLLWIVLLAEYFCLYNLRAFWWLTFYSLAKCSCFCSCRTRRRNFLLKCTICRQIWVCPTSWATIVGRAFPIWASRRGRSTIIYRTRNAGFVCWADRWISFYWLWVVFFQILLVWVVPKFFLLFLGVVDRWLFWFLWACWCFSVGTCSWVWFWMLGILRLWVVRVAVFRWGCRGGGLAFSFTRASYRGSIIAISFDACGLRERIGGWCICFSSGLDGGSDSSIRTVDSLGSVLLLSLTDLQAIPCIWLFWEGICRVRLI